jgi:hypothetical protein
LSFKVPSIQIPTQNEEMKVLVNKFHRRINLVALLFSNSGSRNKTTKSEFRNLKILRVFSYKVWSLKVPHVEFAICGKYSRALKIYKFLNSEYVVMFLDPELLNKKATRFILRWNFMNKTFISPFWVRICMEGTLKT